MKPLDIAFLLGYPQISGGTNVILEYALGLTGRGHQVSIVTELPFDPQELVWKPAAMQLPLLCHADCRERRFDLSIATWWRSVYDLPFVPARRYAYFCQSIESRFFSPLEPDMKALADYTYRQPLEIVTEATWIANYLRDHYYREVTLVLNGIDKEIFRPDGPVVAARPNDHLRVLVEGPLGVSFKQVDLTIELCQRAGMRDVWLLTSSDCREHPGVNRVLSKVPMRDVGAVYRSCDVLVKLSTVEGMFGPPLEMMHCGGTAITSDVTGHDEYMRHGENGLVVRMGNELEVVNHLRALADDRAYLQRLKEGARQTAEAWPGWPQAVEQMERFLVAAANRQQSACCSEECMQRSLSAALRLAGPLHNTLIKKEELSGRQMARVLGRKLKAKIARKLRPEREPTPEPPRSVSPLPHLGNGRALAPKETYRLCFLGVAARDAAHIPTQPERACATFFELGADGGLSDDALTAVRSFGPDVTFVYLPEGLSVESVAALPGYVLGYDSRQISPERLAVLQQLFPAGQDSHRAVLHGRTVEAARLIEAGVHCLGTFLRPVDLDCFGTNLGTDDWESRRIDLLLTGPLPAAWATLRQYLDGRPQFVHVAEWSEERSLAPILAQTRMTLHLAGPDGAPDGAKMLRDMASGCIVVSDCRDVGYNLMAGEHYLFAASSDDLAALLIREHRLPDSLGVMRRLGMQKAATYGAKSAYVELIEQHLVGQPAGAL